MDPRLDENEAELGVFVVTVALEMLADGHGLLDLRAEETVSSGRESAVYGGRPTRW